MQVGARRPGIHVAEKQVDAGVESFQTFLDTLRDNVIGDTPERLDTNHLVDAGAALAGISLAAARSSFFTLKALYPFPGAAARP